MKFFSYLNPRNLPEEQRKRGILAVQREIILQNLLNILLVIVAVGLPVVLIFFKQMIRSGNYWAYILVCLFLIALTVVRRLPYVLRAGIVILALQGFGFMALREYGLSGTGPLFLLGSAILGNILFTPRVGGWFTYLAISILIGLGGLMLSGIIPVPPMSPETDSTKIGQWAVAWMVFAFLIFLATRSLYFILQGMSTALHSQEELSAQLAIERESLEQRVEERSADLQKRVRQFEVASQVAREISMETTLENLLTNAVNMIRDGFGFYHVGVFLTDERNQFAVLRAATGEAGRAMIERNHRLKIGEVGMVGFVVNRGEARIALDVAADAVHYKNPLLPDTRSEMALPLRLGSRTIGALDVQSVLENAFAQEDIGILQTIADQLAVAFEKTRLVEELQRNVDELEANYQASTQKAWKTHLRGGRQKVAYHYRDSRVDSQVEESEHSLQALNQGEIVTRIEPGHGKPVTVLAIPIKLRNQVLGVVDIHFDSTNISPDLISLIEGTVNRLAVSLENARLLEEIQARAERERLVSDISSKVRAASDVDSVLQIAIQEIGRSLGVAEVMVQLRKDS
jgi:GAF domain-containing protein